MRKIKRIAYIAYQIVIAAPLIILASIITALATSLGCIIGRRDFWSYHPPRLWSRFICHILLLKVRVRGRENIEAGKSYIFVSNHQGSFDIFLIYGWLGHNFKWLMKKGLRYIPLIGTASQCAGHILVDKSGPKAIKRTVDDTRHALRQGNSIVLFPEGARSFTGHIGFFTRGAFKLADELQMPVVPITVNGPFDVLPRTGVFIHRHPLELTIHKPIPPSGRGPKNVSLTMKEAHRVVDHGLPEKYQGEVENPDQIW